MDQLNKGRFDVLPLATDDPNNSVLSGEISEKGKHAKGVEILTTSPPLEDTCATLELGSEKKTRGPSVTIWFENPQVSSPFIWRSVVNCL